MEGGDKEIRDVLLSGAEVGATMWDTDKNPSFIHCEPVF
jgi:hypothetical protein